MSDKKFLEEGYLASILDNAVEAIVFMDNNNLIQVWNKGAERIFGYTAEEMIGHTFKRLIPPDQDPEEELEEINEAVRSHGYIENYTTPRITRDGKRITVSLSRTQVTNPDGEEIGSTVIIRDVSEQMELDSRIYNTEKLASIGILAAGVAHEMNNPLSVILGFTDLLLEGFEEGSSEYSDLKTIEYNAMHAKEIVTQLLGFARVTEGIEDCVNVIQSVNTVLKVMGHAFKNDKAELEVDFAPDLPLVHGDPREYQQVVLNLVNNALAALERKNGRIRIKAYVEDRWVRLEVEDNGSGIPDEIKPRIFDPFFTTKEVGQGTGLGLSLCYGIIKKYCGTITFESKSKYDDPDG